MWERDVDGAFVTEARDDGLRAEVYEDWQDPRDAGWAYRVVNAYGEWVDEGPADSKEEAMTLATQALNEVAGKE